MANPLQSLLNVTSKLSPQAAIGAVGNTINKNVLQPLGNAINQPGIQNAGKLANLSMNPLAAVPQIATGLGTAYGQNSGIQSMVKPALNAVGGAVKTGVLGLPNAFSNPSSVPGAIMTAMTPSTKASAPQAPTAPTAPTPSGAMATLVGPNGQRTAVQSGSQQAQQLFGQGYTLEGSAPKSTSTAIAPNIGNLPRPTTQPTYPALQGTMGQPSSSSSGIPQAPAQPAPASEAPAPTNVQPAAFPGLTNNSTGSTTTPDPYAGQISQLRSALTASSNASPAEQALSEQLAQMKAQSTLLNTGLEATGASKGLTTPYVTGIEGARQRQLAAGLAPLEARLAALQGQRGIESNNEQAQLGYLTQDQARADRLNQTNQTNQRADTTKLQDLAKAAASNGASALQVQQILATGDYNKALQAAAPFLSAKQKSDFITVGEGQSVIDPTTGKAVYTNPKSASASQDLNALLTPTEAKELGVSYGTTRGQAFGQSVTGSLTVDQAKAAGFANSANNANDILTKLNFQPNYTGIGGALPNQLKSADRQQFEQASRAFVNAVLRRESGSAITDGEYANKEKELITQPGDSPVVQQQKAQARAQAIANLQIGGPGGQQGGGDVSQYKAQFPGLSDQDIRQILHEEGVQGFNSAPGTALNGLAKSLITQESGGNYNAIGDVPQGYAEADRALGRYQIVPKYHFAKIGLSNTPADRQRFLSSPQLQDKLFGLIVNDLARQYNGNQQKIAAAYYGGPAGAAVVGTQAGNKPQFAGGKQYPSINSYAGSVLSRIA